MCASYSLFPFVKGLSLFCSNLSYVSEDIDLILLDPHHGFSNGAVLIRIIVRDTIQNGGGNIQPLVVKEQSLLARNRHFIRQ